MGFNDVSPMCHVLVNLGGILKVLFLEPIVKIIEFELIRTTFRKFYQISLLIKI